MKAAPQATHRLCVLTGSCCLLGCSGIGLQWHVPNPPRQLGSLQQLGSDAKVLCNSDIYLCKFIPSPQPLAWFPSGSFPHCCACKKLGHKFLWIAKLKGPWKQPVLTSFFRYEAQKGEVGFPRSPTQGRTMSGIKVSWMHYSVWKR